MNRPTRGSNILDLILTTAPETVGPVLHMDGFSNHTKKIRDYSKANYNQINAELETFYTDTFLPLFDHRSVNDNWVL